MYPLPPPPTPEAAIIRADQALREKRDVLATKAMAALIKAHEGHSKNPHPSPDFLAERAYVFADAMLRARER